MTSTVDLQNIFLGLQKQMIIQLLANRENIPHPGTKGDTTELCWVETLNKYLPQRYNAAKAFVLDSEDKLSDQIDIVIFDPQYSPFLFNQNNALYVPAESVYAVIEVKQSINKNMIDYAGEKIASVRQLKRTSSPIPFAAGKYPAKEHFEILGGLVALECEWNPPLGTSFDDAVSKLPFNNRIQLGCALECGGFNVSYFDKEKLRIEKSKKGNALIFFFLSLLARLQELGTVPAMDISEYAKSLEK